MANYIIKGNMFSTLSPPGLPESIDVSDMYRGFKYDSVENALQSIRIDHNMYAWSSIKFKAKKGDVVSLSYTTSSEMNFDWLYAHITTSAARPTFEDTGGKVFQKSGPKQLPYLVSTYTIPSEGDYYLHLGYKKDGSGTNDKDCGWFETISLPVYKNIGAFVNINNSPQKVKKMYVNSNGQKPVRKMYVNDNGIAKQIYDGSLKIFSQQDGYIRKPSWLLSNHFTARRFGGDGNWYIDAVEGQYAQWYVNGEKGYPELIGAKKFVINSRGTEFQLYYTITIDSPGLVKRYDVWIRNEGPRTDIIDISADFPNGIPSNTSYIRIDSRANTADADGYSIYINSIELQ